MCVYVMKCALIVLLTQMYCYSSGPLHFVIHRYIDRTANERHFQDQAYSIIKGGNPYKSTLVQYKRGADRMKLVIGMFKDYVKNIVCKG